VNTININQKKKTIQISAVIIASLVLSTIASQSTFTVYGANPDVGFQDGLSDCQTGTSNAINGHSNAGHHSAEYMDAYKRGLTSCNHSIGSSNGNNANLNGDNSGGGSGASSTASSDWTLTVNLIQPQSVTISATVNLNGPFGYHDSQSSGIGPSPSVIFTVPGNQVPDGKQYQLCVHSNTVSATLPNCQLFMHGSGDEIASLNIPS
jgi:hypothetical protein